MPCMPITLTYNGTTATLSDRLVWVDEFEWSPVVQATSQSTTGALLVDVGVRSGGRPITLDGRDSAAWVTRSLCASLQAWAALPGITLTLTLRGVTRPVIFDHARGGFDARPLWNLSDGEEFAGQVYVPILRFIELPPA